MIRSILAMTALTFGVVGCGSSTTPSAATPTQTVTPNPAPQSNPGPETKLTGTFVCGRCGLKITPRCSNVLQVKDGEQTVNYFLEDRGVKEPYHEEICGDGRMENTTVVGQISEKDGKKYISPSKPVEFVK